MKKFTNLLNFSHAKDIKKQINFSSGLPFAKVLSAESIQSTIAKQNLEYRNRIFTPDLTLWAFLSQVLSDDQSCQAAVARVIAFLVESGNEAPSANTAAYCNARSRLPEELLMELFRRSGKEMDEQAESSWLWRGRNVKLIDGSTISMPDTCENQEAYPQARTQKEGIGFPIARLVAIISCATGAILDLALAPYRGKGTGEHGLLRELIHNFHAGDIILGDAYYCSYFLIAFLNGLGVDAVFPMNGKRDYDFRKGLNLGSKDHLVKWYKPARPNWMDKETYRLIPDEIIIRETEVSLKCKGFRTHSRILVSTFLNPKKVSKQDLNELYDCRWLVEIDLRAIKQTMHMDILRGKSPEMVRKEIWIHLLAYNLIRKVMAQSASIHKKKPRQLSFKLALQVITAYRHAGIFCEKNKIFYKSMLKAIATKTIGNRSGRKEPRRIKRRPKPFKLLQKARQQYQKIVMRKNQNTNNESAVA